MTIACNHDAPAGLRSLGRFVGHPLVTDSLGFRLEIAIGIEEMTGRGQHKTYQQGEKVYADAIHKITINANLCGDELAEVIAHEAYHMFYSVRHLITVDEETEAVVFGQLVKHIHAIASMANK